MAGEMMRDASRPTVNSVQTGQPNPLGIEPPEVDERVLPYLRQEGETRQQKDARAQRTREMLHERVVDEIGVKDTKLLNSFARGQGK